MPEFHYKALSGHGRIRRGVIGARDPREAAGLLRARGLHPVRVKPVKARRANTRRRRRRDPAWAAAFFRRMADLYGAGLPPARALAVLVRQEPSGRRRAGLERIRETLESGEPLSAALEREPGWFGGLEVALVKAGETGGFLDASLERLADHLEKAARFRTRLLTALIYPCVVALVSAVVGFGLIGFVVPRFAAVFLEMAADGQLPAVTRLLMAAGDLVRGNPGVLAGGAAAIIGLIAAALMTPIINERIQWLSVRAGPWKGWVRAAEFHRALRTLGALLGGGVHVGTALPMAASAAANAEVRAALTGAEAGLADGRRLSSMLEDSRICPPAALALIEVGEATGRLAENLEAAANVLENEVEDHMRVMTAWAEPAMVIGLALMVGSVALALFLPLVRLLQGML